MKLARVLGWNLEYSVASCSARRENATDMRNLEESKSQNVRSPGTTSRKVNPKNRVQRQSLEISEA